MLLQFNLEKAHYITLTAVKVWMGLDGEVKINGEDASLPYEKIWRDHEHLTVLRAGSNVSVAIPTVLTKL